ncbi:MAG: beta-ketoacyl-[acyl-carrier-protein] synthase family protein [Thermodesulfobacteriota bacterium]
MDRRVVVTGMGMVTPLGVGREALWPALLRGETGVREVEGFSTAHLASHLGAEVRAFEPRDFVSLKNLRKMDRLSAMVTACARMALDDAGIRITEANRDRVGIMMGTAFGNTELKVNSARILFSEGPNRVNPIHVPNTVMNAPAGHASIETGIRGVNTTVNHLAVSAETALVYGAMEIRRGAADVVLAGGADILSTFFYEALTRFRALSPTDGGMEGAKPFDCARNGPVMGEGCGILCLEAEDPARERGAAPYAGVTGWGLGSSPAPPTGWPEDPRGFILAVERSLAMAGVAPGEIGCIQAAGNGGRNPDALEARAYEKIFGCGGARPLITSIKGATGEIFAAGGIRAAVLALCLREGVVPPTAGLTTPLCPLPFVTGEPRQRQVTHGLLSGVSFGGAYACLVMQRG